MLSIRNNDKYKDTVFLYIQWKYQSEENESGYINIKKTSEQRKLSEPKREFI